MKKGIHPEYKKIKAMCSCGNIVSIWSTLNGNITLDVCYACHPFYTGKQRDVDVRGRIYRFKKRFSISL